MGCSVWGYTQQHSAPLYQAVLYSPLTCFNSHRKTLILSELGVVDWLQGGKGAEHIRIPVNALASDYYFEDTDYFWSTPSCA